MMKSISEERTGKLPERIHKTAAAPQPTHTSSEPRAFVLRAKRLTCSALESIRMRSFPAINTLYSAVPLFGFHAKTSRPIRDASSEIVCWQRLLRCGRLGNLSLSYPIRHT